jgi:hypothetical protein
MTAASAAGQAVVPAGVEREIGPFAPATIGVEFAAGGHGELWSLNGGREWLASGSAAVWWAFGEGRSLLVQFHATEVFQRHPRNAFVHAVVPLLRWRVVEGRRFDVFTELGAGFSWSDTHVPPRGTRFNYVAEGGVGFARRVGRQTYAMAGIRLLHLSNGNRDGASRNPDIEALGGYVALAVGF